MFSFKLDLGSSTELPFFDRGEGPLALYLAKARWICPTIHLFMDLTAAFFAGLPDDDEMEVQDEYVSFELSCLLRDIDVDSEIKLKKSMSSILSWHSSTDFKTLSPHVSPILNHFWL
jgi:hypothetical protein